MMIHRYLSMGMRLMADPDPVAFARALADETRQEIMRLCCCDWISVGAIVDALEVTQPTVSHHLGILREAGLVQLRKRGRQRFYLLNQDKVAFCCGRIMSRYAPDMVQDEEGPGE